MKWAAFGIALAVLGLAACGGGGQAGGAPPGSPGNPGTDTFTVGSAGGTFTTPDGFLRLIVPPGALDEDAQITVGAPAGLPAHPGNLPGLCRTLGPPELVFQDTVELELSYGATDIPPPAGAMQVTACEGIGGSWLPLHANNRPNDYVRAGIEQGGTYGLVAYYPATWCNPPAATVTTMAELETLRGCTTIDQLVVSGPGITSLDPLASVTWASWITIRDCPNLLAVGADGSPGGGGLSALASVDTLVIRNCDALASVHLPALAVIGSDCFVENNPNLVTLDLSGLVAAGSQRGDLLTIIGNDLLETVQMTAVVRLPTTRIHQSPALETLGTFPALRTIHGGLSVLQCGIQTVGDFQALDRVRSVTLRECDALSDLTGLSLGFVEEDLRIIENAGLLNVGGLIATVGRNLEIAECDGLSDFSGLGVTNVGQGLLIRGNTGLTSLQGVSIVQNMSSLLVEDCGQLEDLQGLGTLPPHLSSFSVRLNGNMQDLNGAETLNTADAIEIYNNWNLTSLDGLDNLRSVTGNLILWDLQILASIEALRGLESVGGMTLWDCDRLTDLEPLSTLRRLGWGVPAGAGDLDIWNNLNLSDITALHGLEKNPGTGFAINRNLSITTNVSLGNPAANAFLDAIGGPSAVGGTITIQDN